MKRKATDHDGTDNVNRRLHNVLFNTHTVSGIVISVALYVIFLAGAFALFQNNINNWEINEPAKEFSFDLDYERILAEVEKKGYQMYSRDFVVSLAENNGKHLRIFANPPANTIAADSLAQLPEADSAQYAEATARLNYVINPETYQLTEPDEANGDRKSTRLNSSHSQQSRMPSSA